MFLCCHNCESVGGYFLQIVSQLESSTILGHDKSFEEGGASMQEGGVTVESESEGHIGSAVGTQSIGEKTAERDEQLELDSGNIKIYL